MSAPRPFTLIAELTHRCPLRCPYCSNPVDLTRDELAPAVWERAIAEAEALGVVQLHLTGGEPLRYAGLDRLVACAHRIGLYVNLITSGIPLTRDRIAALHERGLDHIQLSIQDAEVASANAIAGVRVFDRKLEVAHWIKQEGLPLTLNAVLHRANIDRTAAIIALAERLGADRLELANVRYLGHAFVNRAALAPTRAQIDEAFDHAAEARARLAGVMEIVFVKPDLFTSTPRACMDGWGRRYLHITPSGRVLPCHAAECIPGLAFESIDVRPLGEIWESSEALARFRGEAWMKEPCRSCERRAIDFGGCRCQAYLLTGDAAATDPACILSPRRDALARIIEAPVSELRLRSRAR